MVRVPHDWGNVPWDVNKAYGSARRLDDIVGYIKNGDCLEFDDIHFSGNNQYAITFSSNSTSVGNRVELWLDGTDKCKGAGDYLFNLKTFIIGNTDIDIQTNEDSFAAGFDRPLLQRLSGEDVNWSVQALEGGATTLAKIEKNGLLTCNGDRAVRVMAISKTGPNLIGERLITLRHCNSQ